MADIDKLSAALSDRYHIERELGAGGMATVYLAEDLRNHRRVAVKVLRSDLSALLGTDRFLNEIRVTANLQHPHVLPLFDSGEADGQLFYVMPYVEGEALSDRIEREKQLPVEEAVRIAREVASALDYAHRHGVIHRDIKPANILLQDGTALVSDFGIALAVSNAGGARLTETGLSLGTPYYMSPEQATGDRQLDARSDVYSLGAVLYEMLTGDPPHTGSTAQAVIAAVVTEPPRDVAARRPRIAPHVAEAVHRALEKLPADRYATAADFARALEGPAATTGRTTAFRAAPRPAPKRWLAVALGLAGVAIGLAAGRLLLAPRPLREVRTRLTFTGDAQFPAVTNDGRWLAYIRGGCAAGGDETGPCLSDVVVQELPAGVPAVLVAGARRVGPPEWSPDGSALLVSMTPAGSPHGLYLVPRAGGVPRKVADEVTGYGFADEHRASYLDRRGPVIRLADLATGETRDSVVIAGWLLNSADFSSKSGLIFFSGIHGSALRLGIADAHGRVLDTLGQIGGGGWDPDGRHVLVGSVDARSLVHLLRMGVSGGGRFTGKPVELIGGIRQNEWTGLALTPTGYVIGDASTTEDVWAFTLGGASRRLTHSSTWYFGPAVAPDGRTVAYVKQDAWGANVYTGPVAPGPERPVTTDSGIRQVLRWFPDSKRISQIVLQSSGPGGFTHEIAELETGRRHPFALAPGMIVVGWRPDATAFAEQLDGSALALVDTSGKALRRFPLPDSLRPLVSVQGAPDGKEAALLFGEPPRSRFLALDVASGALRAIGAAGPADSARNIIPLRWAADGHVYFARKAGSGPLEIWRIPARGGAAQRVAGLPVRCDASSLSLALDGRTGACLVVDERPDLYLVERRR